MNAIEQSPSHNQQNFVSLPDSSHNLCSINDLPVLEYKHAITVPNNSNQDFEPKNSKRHSIIHIQPSPSEYLNSWLFSADLSTPSIDKKNESFFKSVFSIFSRTNQDPQSKLHKKLENQDIPSQSLQEKPAVDQTNQNQFMRVPCYSDNRQNVYVLLSERPQFIYNKPLKDLQSDIIQVYDEHQEEGWDGYGAKPIQNLPQALQFATALFQESTLLVKKVDIVPENDGAICFEWFISNERYISVSVKGSRLIYSYQMGDDEGCGERSFSNSSLLIDQIKRVAVA